jgi:hypothetical protein
MLVARGIFLALGQGMSAAALKGSNIKGIKRNHLLREDLRGGGIKTL